MEKVKLIKRLFTNEEIIAIDNRNRELEEENKKLKKENFVMKDRLKFGYKGVTREEIEIVEEENRKLKFDIEARKEMKKAREEKSDFLEQCLDNKEKVNKSLREENEKLRIDREFEKGNTIFGM